MDERPKGRTHYVSKVCGSFVRRGSCLSIMSSKFHLFLLMCLCQCVSFDCRSVHLAGIVVEPCLCVCVWMDMTAEC